MGCGASQQKKPSESNPQLPQKQLPCLAPLRKSSDKAAGADHLTKCYLGLWHPFRGPIGSLCVPPAERHGKFTFVQGITLFQAACLTARSRDQRIHVHETRDEQANTYTLVKDACFCSDTYSLLQQPSRRQDIDKPYTSYQIISTARQWSRPTGSSTQCRTRTVQHPLCSVDVDMVIRATITATAEHTVFTESSTGLSRSTAD